MRKMLSKYLRLICIIIIIMPLHSYASDDSTGAGMTESQWQQLTNDPAFGYKNEREYVVKEVKNTREFGKFWDKLLNFFSGGAGQIILWAVLFAIFGYLLYYLAFSKNGSFFFSRSKKVKARQDENPADFDDISRTDWDNLVQEAIRSGDYRNAIRYSYIRLLQILQEHELIAYRNDKTNFEYYNELDDTPYKAAFKHLSRQYEYAWYGHFTLQDDAFRKYMDEFNQLKKQLSR